MKRYVFILFIISATSFIGKAQQAYLREVYEDSDSELSIGGIIVVGIIILLFILGKD